MDLGKVLSDHALWLNRDGGRRANLRWADLREANLRWANLREANLREANLREADLRGANLRGANLRGANLRWADLREANLREADLRAADLREADLRGANLCAADLRGADLREANLREANLREAGLPDYHTLPSTGPLTVYKCVKGAILTLFVPHDSPRAGCLTSNKCRVDRAKVIATSDATVTARMNLGYGTARPLYYVLGEWVEADEFDDDIREQCTHGIHVFATYAEAKAYQ